MSGSMDGFIKVSNTSRARNKRSNTPGRGNQPIKDNPSLPTPSRRPLAPGRGRGTPMTQNRTPLGSPGGGGRANVGSSGPGRGRGAASTSPSTSNRTPQMSKAYLPQDTERDNQKGNSTPKTPSKQGQSYAAIVSTPTADKSNKRAAESPSVTNTPSVLPNIKKTKEPGVAAMETETQDGDPPFLEPPGIKSTSKQFSIANTQSAKAATPPAEGASSTATVTPGTASTRSTSTTIELPNSTLEEGNSPAATEELKDKGATEGPTATLNSPSTDLDGIPKEDLQGSPPHQKEQEKDQTPTHPKKKQVQVQDYHIDPSAELTNKFYQARPSLKTNPLKASDILRGNQNGVLRKVLSSLFESEYFREEEWKLGDNIKWLDVDFNTLSQEAIASAVSEAFERGNSDTFPKREEKARAQKFFLHLAETPLWFSEQWDDYRCCFTNPNVLDRFHYQVSRYFGPVCIAIPRSDLPPRPSEDPDSMPNTEDDTQPLQRDRKPPPIPEKRPTSVKELINKYFELNEEEPEATAVPKQVGDQQISTPSTLTPEGGKDKGSFSDKPSTQSGDGTLQPSGAGKITFLDVTFSAHQPINGATKKEDNDKKKEIVTMQSDHLLNTLFTSDPFIRIYPYPGADNRADRKLEVLRRGSPPGTRPRSAFAMANYIKGYYIRDSGAPVVGRIKLYHTRDIREILREVNPTVEEEVGDLVEPPAWAPSFKLSVCTLQVEKVVTTCWGHGTHRFTDIDKLCSAIKDTTEWKTHPRHIQLGGVARLVRLLPQEQFETGDLTFAVHFTVAEEDYGDAMMLLGKIYSEKKKHGFPLDIKLHMVPDVMSPMFSNTNDPHILAMLDCYRDSQREFCRSLRQLPLENVIRDPFAGLNDNAPKLTLNKVILAMTDSRNSDGARVYVSLDKHPLQSNVWMLTYRLDNQAEANSVSLRLGTLVVALFGDHAKNWFQQPYILKQQKDYPYDRDKQEFKCPETAHLMRLSNMKSFASKWRSKGTYKAKDFKLLTNIQVQVSPAFRTRSAFPSVLGNGELVATTIQDKAEQAQSVNTVEMMFDNDTFSDEEGEGSDVQNEAMEESDPEPPESVDDLLEVEPQDYRSALLKLVEDQCGRTVKGVTEWASTRRLDAGNKELDEATSAELWASAGKAIATIEECNADACLEMEDTTSFNCITTRQMCLQQKVQPWDEEFWNTWKTTWIENHGSESAIQTHYKPTEAPDHLKNLAMDWIKKRYPNSFRNNTKTGGIEFPDLMNKLASLNFNSAFASICWGAHCNHQYEGELVREYVEEEEEGKILDLPVILPPSSHFGLSALSMRALEEHMSHRWPFGDREIKNPSLIPNLILAQHLNHDKAAQEWESLLESKSRKRVIRLQKNLLKMLTLHTNTKHSMPIILQITMEAQPRPEDDPYLQALLKVSPPPMQETGPRKLTSSPNQPEDNNPLDNPFYNPATHEELIALQLRALENLERHHTFPMKECKDWVLQLVVNHSYKPPKHLQPKLDQWIEQWKVRHSDQLSTQVHDENTQGRVIQQILFALRSLRGLNNFDLDTALKRLLNMTYEGILSLYTRERVNLEEQNLAVENAVPPTLRLPRFPGGPDAHASCMSAHADKWYMQDPNVINKEVLPELVAFIERNPINNDRLQASALWDLLDSEKNVRLIKSWQLHAFKLTAHSVPPDPHIFEAPREDAPT